MEETGSTSLRAELQVLLEDPTNFYNVVMSNSGERGGAHHLILHVDGRGSSLSFVQISRSRLPFLLTRL